jgi:crotonobetainyl-CoA:carnitine CoA-transferase CaiB-like acyl-CoA transferase
MARLEQADIPVMPVHDLDSLLEDPHLRAIDFFEIAEHPTEGAIRSMRVSPEWSETPAVPPRLAPRLGEQSREILGEAGYSAAEIAQLIETGVTRPLQETKRSK